MFLQLAHTKLDAYKASRGLVLESYRITKAFPVDKRFAMIQQIRRAAVSVHLNLSEGCSRKSKTERSRYFEVSRGSVVELDRCLDLPVELNYVTSENLKPLGVCIVKAFKLLTGMI